MRTTTADRNWWKFAKGSYSPKRTRLNLECFLPTASGRLPGGPRLIFTSGRQEGTYLAKSEIMQHIHGHAQTGGGVTTGGEAWECTTRRPRSSEATVLPRQCPAPLCSAAPALALAPPRQPRASSRSSYACHHRPTSIFNAPFPLLPAPPYEAIPTH